MASALAQPPPRRSTSASPRQTPSASLSSNACPTGCAHLGAVGQPIACRRHGPCGRARGRRWDRGLGNSTGRAAIEPWRDADAGRQGAVAWVPPKRSQLWCHPRWRLLRARVREGEAVPRRAHLDGRLLPGAWDRVRGVRQARGRNGQARTGAPGGAGTSLRRQRRAGPAVDGREPSGARAPRGWCGRAARPGHGDRRLRRRVPLAGGRDRGPRGNHPARLRGGRRRPTDQRGWWWRRREGPSRPTGSSRARGCTPTRSRRPSAGPRAPVGCGWWRFGASTASWCRTAIRPRAGTGLPGTGPAVSVPGGPLHSRDRWPRPRRSQRGAGVRSRGVRVAPRGLAAPPGDGHLSRVPALRRS